MSTIRSKTMLAMMMPAGNATAGHRNASHSPKRDSISGNQTDSMSPMGGMAML